MIGYPAIFTTDEWISANQLNHLTTGNSLLSGFDKYGSLEYSGTHGNILVYTLALPILALPVFSLFSLLQDSFRMFVIILFFVLVTVFLFLLRRWYPEYSSYKGIPWVFGAFFLNIFFLLLNIILYRPFTYTNPYSGNAILAYPEVAALVFTNEIAFAATAVFAFLIFREIFDSDWWGLFGLAAIFTGSSYLFWSGNAKDHMLAVLFGLVAAYLFILFIKREQHLWLFASFIAIGWLAFVRPELGLSTAICFLIAAFLISLQKGGMDILKSIGSATGVFVGAIPLFLNNLGLMGNPFLPPTVLLPVIGQGSGGISQISRSYFSVGYIDPIQSLFGVLIDPGNKASAGIFQVSPLAVFGLAFAGLVIIRIFTPSLGKWDRKEFSIVILSILWILASFMAYIKSFNDLSFSLGIVPDIRYYTPMYVPLLILGLMFFKTLGFTEPLIKTSLKTLALLVIAELPVLYIVCQVFWPQSLPSQIAFNMGVTFLFLFIVVLVTLIVMLKKVPTIWLAYSIPFVMVSSLMWELIVDFRFATFVWEGYHFWLPVVQYLWYVQYILFPL